MFSCLVSVWGDKPFISVQQIVFACVKLSLYSYVVLTPKQNTNTYA